MYLQLPRSYIRLHTQITICTGYNFRYLSVMLTTAQRISVISST